MSYPPGPPGPQDADDPGPGDPRLPPDDSAEAESPGAPPPGYGHPAPQHGGPPPGFRPQGPRPTNTKATAALITGITTLVLAWCCGFGVLGAVAVVLGVKARSEVRDSRGMQEGDGIALAGIITGAAAIVIGVLVLVAIIVVIASGQGAYTEYYNDFS
jgi:hypothetical protein